MILWPYSVRKCRNPDASYQSQSNLPSGPNSCVIQLELVLAGGPLLFSQRCGQLTVELSLPLPDSCTLTVTDDELGEYDRKRLFFLKGNKDEGRKRN